MLPLLSCTNQRRNHHALGRNANAMGTEPVLCTGNLQVDLRGAVLDLPQLLLVGVAAVADATDPAVDHAGGVAWQLKSGLDSTAVVVTAHDNVLDLQGFATDGDGQTGPRPS
jgi:hypothetical protein